MRIFYDDGEGEEGQGTPAPEGGKQESLVGKEGKPQDAPPPGSQPADWKASLPEELRSHTSLQKVSDIEGLARGFISAQKMVGKPLDKLLEIPDAEDKDARLATLRKLGAPQDATAVKLTAPEGTPETLSPETPLAKTFATKAAELGLLPEQYNGVYQWFTGEMSEALKQQETSAEQTATANVGKLKEEWGQAFDQNVRAANFAIEKLGGDPLVQALNDANLGTNPDVLKAFAKVSKFFSEDHSADGAGGSEFGGPLLAPTEARARAQQLQQEAIGLKVGDPRRRELTAKAQEYYKMANAG